MPGRLIGRGGKWAGMVYPLGDAVISLGRSAENQLVFADQLISRRHAELRWDGVLYVLYDLGSKNGIAVNGERVAAQHVLADGDIISVPGLAGLQLAFEADEDTVTARAGARPQAAVVIDPRTTEVRVRGVTVNLTAKEYHGLALLYERGGALVTKNELAERVWPEFAGAVSDDSIENLIYRLRRKLEEDPERPRQLLTVRGRGYRLGVS